MDKMIITGMMINDNIGDALYTQHSVSSSFKMAAMIMINFTPEEDSKLPRFG